MKIDIVMPWVDGGDLNWLKEKNKYSPNPDQDVRDMRFRDWGFLPYWFRGVEKFAPWINKIHFVTWGHVPEWLNTDHPKLNIVKHEDYIPKEYLPTFSSHPIELNMHRIEGLSEHFIYFNDDWYFTKPIRPTDYFRNGLPCDCLVESAITPRQGEFSMIICATTAVINKYYTKKDLKKLGPVKTFNPRYRELLVRTLSTKPYTHIMGFYNPHLPQPFLKSTLEETWEKEGEILDRTCRNKFRTDTDVSQYLFRYFNLCEGNFYPMHPIGKYFIIGAQTDKICKALLNSPYKVIAMNDKDDIADFDAEQAKIDAAFRELFPEPSSFER